MPRSSRAPLIVVISVLALIALTVLPFAVYGGSSDPEDVQTTTVVAILLVPGAFIAVSWLARMAQWLIALRAKPQAVTVTAYLAQTPQPSERGKAVQAMDAVSRMGNINTDPSGFAVWLGFHDASGQQRYQRVIPARWLMSLSEPETRATVRHAAGVSVINIDGQGRLWPASFALARHPFGVRLTPFANAASLDEKRYMSTGKLLYVVGLVLIPCAGLPALSGDLAGAAWGAAYVASLTFTIGTWFGVIPPAWRPRNT